jgi:hypothetical protein
MIELDTDMTPELLKIDTDRPGYLHDLSIATASAKYNKLGGNSFCQCSRDCRLNASCSCIKLGKLCRGKCHKPRKDGLPVKCSNCLTFNHLTIAEPTLSGENATAIHHNGIEISSTTVIEQV